MTYLPTEEDLALLKSRSKRLYCRIELLNKNYQIIDMIEGLALSGSNSIDADSDTRRTFNLDIFPKKGFSISQFSTEEWTSKMLRLRIGMKAPTSESLIDLNDITPSEDKIESVIKNDILYISKAIELRQAIWRYQIGGYAQYGNIDNINRQRIMWTDENKTKYATFLEEQGESGTCSSHDFQKTPDKNELVSRMVKMQQVGADLPKVAVMPHDRTDVLTLLSATIEMKNKYFVTPVITISMGKLGVASRLCGEVFGSAMTFASAGDSSAPGQISIDVVNAVLDSITE